jgi:hypothetical protein
MTAHDSRNRIVEFLLFPVGLAAGIVMDRIGALRVLIN